MWPLLFNACRIECLASEVVHERSQRAQYVLSEQFIRPDMPVMQIQDCESRSCIELVLPAFAKEGRLVWDTFICIWRLTSEL